MFMHMAEALQNSYMHVLVILAVIVHHLFDMRKFFANGFCKSAMMTQGLMNNLNSESYLIHDDPKHFVLQK